MNPYYWVNMNNDIENAIKNYLPYLACHTLNFWSYSQKKTDLKWHQGISWEPIGTDIFMVNNKSYSCIIDYFSEFLVVMHMDGYSAVRLIKPCQIIFLEYEFLWDIMSNASTKVMGILQVTEYPTHHIIIIKPSKQFTSRGMCKIHIALYKEMFDTHNNVYLAILQYTFNINCSRTTWCSCVDVQ